MLDSRQYILGPECAAFEAEFAAFLGVRHAVVTSSGTAALWMALRVLGVKAGDEVLVPALTAFPTVEAICVAQAIPVFVDIDRWATLDADDAAGRITPRAVGIVPVHLYGQPADMTAIRDFAARFGLWILEDCCQAHGATWDDRVVGGGGRAAAFSFYPSKNLPMLGDGGAVVTGDDEIATRVRRLRDHGRSSRDVHAELGFNLRLNEMQATIGRVMLRRLPRMNERRRALAARYRQALDGLPLILPDERPHARHVYHLYVVRTAEREALRAFLASRGIQTGIHYPVPAHRQPALEPRAATALPATERLVDEILSLPLSPGHSDGEVDEVAAAIREFFGR